MVVRINKNKNYTAMSNIHLKDKTLSLKAKGLLSLMLSLPEDWHYSIAGLVAICKENETAIKSTIDELKCVGYVKVTKKLPNETTTGRYEYVYDIFEQKQEGEKQGVEIQGVEVQGVENQGQLNTNEQITNELNTDDIIYITQSGHFDYQKIVDMWNNTCLALPKVKLLTETRKRQIRASNKQIEGNWQSFFDMINASDFLCGRKTKWKASFDWCLKPANLVKILEGNYNNKENSYMNDLREWANGE